MSLSRALHIAAWNIFDRLNAANIPAYLLGGAAIQLNGGDRYTKDLDLNAITVDLRKRLSADFLFSVTGVDRARMTYLGGERPIRCDLRVQRSPPMKVVLPYTTVTEDGIRYALPSLLLATKLRAMGERNENIHSGKLDSDAVDVEFCVGKMLAEEAKMPDLLKAAYITEAGVQMYLAIASQSDQDMVPLLEEMLVQVGAVDQPSGGL
ncbi:hypothetical protein NLJ89_g7414 [Agrocybe chaxingu]|uniref:Uncharacterized protein n=1 Tax=Agrocybe chaxingu TaxID=84603 RepID=A0A9W8MRS4_9AGAR|nr:hypothetical protein NLJ89_g7414 [Agrocybe chaxingu]